MIIKRDSFFRFPPKKLDREQVIILNAVTFSVDICDLSYQRLVILITEFSENPKSQEQIYPEIFSEVWSIINNSTIFLNLIKTHFKVNSFDLLEELEKAKKLRNSNQHIDERISEIFISANMPIYGSLWWTKNFINTNKFSQYFLFAGVFTHNESVSSTMISPKANPENEIESINFDYIIREKKDFVKLTVSLDKLMIAINILINNIDTQIEKQILSKEGINMDRHNSNLFFEIRGRRISDENQENNYNQIDGTD